METILEEYYADNAKRLRGVVDRILMRLGFSGFVDSEDFYSLANEIFVDVIRRYDEKQQGFEAFLYSCLTSRFKTEMTRLNRQKRQADRMSISIDTPVGDEEDSVLGDMIADSYSVEKEIFEGKEGYGSKVLRYLGRLSQLQREVLNLAADGYFPGEIRELLHITEKQYMDCNAAIHSYRNISILF